MYPLRCRCIVCGQSGLLTLRRTRLVNKFNPEGLPVWVHRGECAVCNDEATISHSGLLGTMAVLYERRLCCVCGTGAGFFGRRRLGDISLVSGYNQACQPAHVHDENCFDLYVKSHQTLWHELDMSELLRQLAAIRDAHMLSHVEP